MAQIVGCNLYIDGVKHNSSPIPLVDDTYDISDVEVPGEDFQIQASFVLDDGTESVLTAPQTHTFSNGTSVEAETIAGFAAAEIENDSTVNYSGTAQEKTNSQWFTIVDNSIKHFKSTSVWNKIHYFNPFIGLTGNNRDVNFKSPGQFIGGFSGGWTHDKDGSKPNGTSGYFNTGFPADTLAATDFAVSFSVLSNSSTTAVEIAAAASGTADNVLVGVNLSGKLRIRIGGTNHEVTNSSQTGIYTASRKDNIVKGFKNKTEVLSESEPSELPLTGRILYYGAQNGTSVNLFTDRTLGSLIFHNGDPAITNDIQEGIRIIEEGLVRFTFPT